jgi:pilus assembly protein CpaE
MSAQRKAAQAQAASLDADQTELFRSEVGPETGDAWADEVLAGYAEEAQANPRPGHDFNYDEILEQARQAIEGGYEPSPDHAVGQMQSGIAEAFAEPELRGPVFEAEPDGVAARITIHLFCELGETAEVGERALKDRRLARASGAIFTGGLSAAVARYKSQPTPSLVIVEAAEDGDRILAGLDGLAEVCDAGTKVMVIGRRNDIALYRELVRRGVSEYLVAPLDPMALVAAIGGLYEDPSAPFAGRTVAVVGAKGGAGASVLAHNLAHALSERIEAGTVLVDLDLPFGAAGLNFNQDPLQGVAHALSDPERLDAVLLDRMMVRCTDRLSLFAAPANLDDDYDISAPAYAEVTHKVRAAAPFVVLDLPHLWSGWMRQTLLSADEAVVVATPELTSLRNAKNLIELLLHGRPNDGPPRLVLNQMGVPGRPEISAKDFAEAVGIEPTLILPFEPKLYGQAANNGQMIGEMNAKAKAAEAIAALARAIARRETAAAPQAKPSVLGALFKRKA